MRILIAGAGAAGGYFGTRLVQAGRDVTFLLGPRRAEQLRDGLRLVGPGGEETMILPFLNGMARLQALNDRFRPARVLGGILKVVATVAMDVVGAMWHKGAFIAAAGVITCLMCAPVGAVVAAPDGEQFIRAVIAETEQIAAAADHPLPTPEHDAMVAMLAAPGSGFTSSLYRDVTAGHAHEGEHLLGAFVTTATDLGVDTPLIALALLQLRAHDHATV